MRGQKEHETPKGGLSFASPRFRRFARRPAAARETPYVGADRIKFEGYALSGNRTPVSRALRKRRMARPLYIGNAEPEEPISSPAPASSGGDLEPQATNNRAKVRFAPKTAGEKTPKESRRDRQRGQAKRAPKKNNSQRKKKETKKEGRAGATREGEKRRSAPGWSGKRTGKREEAEKAGSPAARTGHPPPGGARRETPRPKTQTRMFRAPSMILLSSSTLIS